MPNSVAREGRCPQEVTSAAPTAVQRRLPGAATPREEALREYQDFNAKRRSRIPAALWPFWAPDPEQFYRWRVQLECGCITEVLTNGSEKLPAEGQGYDPLHKGRLPAGQVRCSHDDPPPAPYRNIVAWGERREVSFPADPVEPPDWTDAESWAVIRHDEPHTSAFWTVTLSCGHLTEVVAPDLQWKPTNGPKRAIAKRLPKMKAAFEEFWASDPEGQDEHKREHTRRMLEDGWPCPRPEQQCHTCSWAKWIVAYQRVGWLVPRKPEPKQPKTPKPPSRASLQRRLRQAEVEAKQLREQLSELDEETASEKNS
ncbi:hypothetical protein ACQEVG_21400 [Streptomyces sp. CA-135486]|uniref:hypothetical protein n=1 Tax=Streptomyces sp. CA-135486 TaxID=3240049 RepID=UPI003D92AA80